MSKFHSPYRSKRRDETRVSFPLDFSTDEIKSESYEEDGLFHYSEGGQDFSETFKRAKNNSHAEITKSFLRESESIVQCINDVYRIASRYMWTIYGLSDTIVSPVQDVLFPCFHKSLVSLYVSHDLTISGLYGPARPHLRHAFESLMIAKYCSVNPESDVFDRWVDGVDIYFTNAILKRIRHPFAEEFIALWKLLCQWSHSTVFAGQSDLSIRNTKSELLMNFGIIEVFLQWSYHLLNSHILTRSVRYYGDRYCHTNKANKARERLNQTFKRHLRFLGIRSRRLIRDYRATWTIT